MKIIMLGVPGAGKGTQAALLTEKLNVPHISTGDIFRANIRNRTPLGEEAKHYIDAGELVPDEVTIAMVIDRLDQPDCAEGYILDGFPRTLVQAEHLKEELDSRGTQIDHAVYIDVPDEEIVERMAGRRMCPKCGASYHIHHVPPRREGICDRCGEPLVTREDDMEETVRKRIAVYHDLTHPLTDYYEAQGILVTVDGTLPMKGVFQAILDGLGV